MKKKEKIIQLKSILEDLEKEIIEIEAKAYEVALTQFFPIISIFKHYISEYRRKKTYQSNIIIGTAIGIYTQPDKRNYLIQIKFTKFYKNDPLYSLLNIYVPSFRTSKNLKTIKKRFKNTLKRFFKRRVVYIYNLFKQFERIAPNNYHSRNELVRRIFKDKNLFYLYINDNIEIERRKYSIIKKRGDLRCLTPVNIIFDINSLSIPLYHYLSEVWRIYNETLSSYLKSKIEELYFLKSISKEDLSILSSRDYRYKLVKEFPRTPKKMLEILHNPKILMENYPDNKLKVEKIASNRLRYTIIEKVPLINVEIRYDFVWEWSYIDNTNNIKEKWWIENGNYMKEMTGFAIYEESEGGHCKYADIVAKAILIDKLKPFEHVITPVVENTGKKNLEILMENIYNKLIEEDKNLTQNKETSLSLCN
ncbi:MAG: hypothetical protein ACTSPY_07340 [Candidatus Helarchaeota archaeon]